MGETNSGVEKYRSPQASEGESIFVLDQHVYLYIYSVSSLKQVYKYTCHLTLTHYTDCEPTSLCCYSFMICAKQ
jgi:hypothetical protein